MSRKDDPVFNVKFVQLVENHPCLWNSTLPAYSKKDEIQKAWQEVANETKDSVRSCRERWRTIRSSFLRSLKLAPTTTGRGKRKYYLSKYLQFLIPYTKTRMKNSNTTPSVRKTFVNEPPMTRISNMPVPVASGDDTKDDSSASEMAIAEEDVVVSLHEEQQQQQQQQQAQQTQQSHHQQPQNVQQQQPQQVQQAVLPTQAPQQQQLQQLQQQLLLQQQQQQLLLHQRLLPIKCEIGTISPEGFPQPLRRCPATTVAAVAAQLNGFGTDAQQHLQQQQQQAYHQQQEQHQQQTSQQQNSSSSAVDLTEFADWIKSKNDHHRHCLMPSSPDADQSFLNSLHPFMKEMTGKQNLRFRQKAIVLIDAILDDAD